MKPTDFLKKYTTINKHFLDDFYQFYDEEYTEYDFVINLRVVSKWIGVRIDNLKSILINNFKKDIDWIIVKNKLKKVGRTRENILLTYDCFKMVCMLSRSKKSNDVRRYYVEVEKHLILYRKEIINDIHKQIGIKTMNQKIMKDNKKKSLIYVLKVDTKSDIYKIGKTKDLKKRIQNYNVGRVKEYEIVYVMKTHLIDEIEKCIKKNLIKHAIKFNSQELIKLNLERIKETIEYCSRMEIAFIRSRNYLMKDRAGKGFIMMIDKDNDNIDFYNKLDTLQKTKKKAKSKAQTKPKVKKNTKSKAKTKTKSKAKTKTKSKAKTKTKSKAKTKTKSKSKAKTKTKSKAKTKTK